MATQLEIPPNGKPMHDPITRDWVVYHDGTPVAFGSSSTEAQRQYDTWRANQNAHGGLLRFGSSEASDDPLTLYAPGGPRPDLPVDTAALDAALAHFSATYPQPELQRRAERARAILSNPSQWSVLADGTMQVVGSTTYSVSDQGCVTPKGRPCPDQVFRARDHGQCKHQIARELLRLAQVFMTLRDVSASGPQPPGIHQPAPLPDAADAPLRAKADADPTASVVVPADLLAAAWGFVWLADTESISVAIDGDDLHLTAGPHSLILHGAEGAGHAQATLVAADVATAWARLKRLPKEMGDDDTHVVLMIDPVDTTLALLPSSGESLLITYQV